MTTYQEFLDNKGENKWQDYWDENKIFVAKDFDDKPKFYGLVEFPYPSGEGLHVGHPRSYTAMDIICRKRRMQGQNVLFSMGWDAFGLPAENYAIKTGTHPREKTQENIKNYKRQLKAIGYSFDWSREVDTTDPQYFKWTQWIFLQLFKKGLAYKEKSSINFCVSCKVGLANEEVVSGKCERCGGEVVKKEKEQWMLKITEYADRLDKDLDDVDYLDRIKIQQRNWIGRSKGAEVFFSVISQVKGESPESLTKEDLLKVYTTRLDTLFGATYMVIAPEHFLIEKMKDKISNYDEVRKYVEQSAKKSDMERTELSKVKTGVELKGIKAINPVNGQEISVWAADYVLVSYGTGAIMAVPAHDDRDWEFAKKYNLPIVEVIKGGDIEKEAYTDIEKGEMVNSDFLNGMSPNKAIGEMIKWLEEKGLGKPTMNYKLRDWVFSRQRYWGEPIPLVNCSKCGWVAIDESELPLELPEMEEYKPGEDGRSPLARATDWVKTTCPKCGGLAERETDTMPQWAGSSWYFLRYCDPQNDGELASEDKLKYWTPVDWYNGGMEHTTLHLLYSRFWHKFLYDIGIVPTSEPYQKRTSHGMILGEGSEKMSKSKGNVINPDDVIAEYGADTLRCYEMFMGPFDQMIPWDTKGVIGVRRFLDKVWNIFAGANDANSTANEANEILANKTIKQVSEDIENMKFNTAVSALMIMANKLSEQEEVSVDDLSVFVKLLYPFAPHIAEELWQQLGNKGSIAYEAWPEYDESKIKEDEIEFVVQINGKVRAKLRLSANISKDDAIKAAKNNDNVRKYIADKKIKKEIFVPGKLISLVL